MFGSYFLANLEKYSLEYDWKASIVRALIFDPSLFFLRPMPFVVFALTHFFDE